MANVNSTPEQINYVTEDECVPGNAVRDTFGKPVRTVDGSFVLLGEEQLDPGPRAAKDQGLTIARQIPKNFLVSIDNPNPPGGVGRLNTLYTKAVMTVLGQASSGLSYNLIGASDFVGKYQIDASTLADLGYIKTEYVSVYSRASVKKDIAWTGKDGITSLLSWFNSPGVQEKTMYQLLQQNYNIMLNNGAITSADNLCTIAGMLCVAHILGPGTGTEKSPGAKRWRETGGGQDINGNFAAYYFALGRYAVDVLAART